MDFKCKVFAPIYALAADTFALYVSAGDSGYRNASPTNNTSGGNLLPNYRGLPPFTSLAGIVKDSAGSKKKIIVGGNSDGYFIILL